MPIARYKIPQLANWQEFENLCCELWAKKWEYPDTQKNGRQGQKQHGVDVYGRPQSGKNWAGVQCKGKDNFEEKTLTEKEVLAEVEKAKTFEPPLSEYTIATTGPTDANIQKLAREITTRHSKCGLFSVTVFFWEDIVRELEKYPDICGRYFPEVTTFPEITKKLTVVTESVDAGIRRIEEKIELNNVGFSRNTVDSSSFNEQIDYGRDLLKKHKYITALEYYSDLRLRIWTNAKAPEKYRLLANLGMANLVLKRESEAGKLFIEAFQYNPSDDKALCNKALGFFMLNQSKEASEAISKALQLNPANCFAYALRVKISKAEESFESILNKVPSAYRTDSDVAYALGYSARERGSLSEARKWFELAVNNDESNSPDLKSVLGATVLETITTQHPEVWVQVDEATKMEIENAIKLITTAWDDLGDSESKKIRCAWLANRSLAKRILNDRNGAIQDLDTLLEFDANNADYIKRRAILACEKNDWETAIALLERIKDCRETPEAKIILAEVLAKQDKIEDAIALLKEILDNLHDSRWHLEAADLDLTPFVRHYSSC